jgi:hypothetical protein
VHLVGFLFIVVIADLKHELLNRPRSTMAANVLTNALRFLHNITNTDKRITKKERKRTLHFKAYRSSNSGSRILYITLCTKRRNFKDWEANNISIIGSITIGPFHTAWCHSYAL